VLNYTNGVIMSWVTVECCQCDRCGHVWIPAGRLALSGSALIRATISFLIEKPKRCAKCKSPAWNAKAGAKGKAAEGATMPAPDARRPVVQSAEPKPSDVWAPGTSRKTQADFLAKYGREPRNRVEAELFAKRGY